jgi:hypothetical protein
MSEVTVLEAVDTLIEEMRATKTKVVRNGKVVLHAKCPPGTIKGKDGQCKLQTSAQKRAYKQAGIKRSKSSKRRAPSTLVQGAKKRLKSMKVRSSHGL